MPNNVTKDDTYGRGYFQQDSFFTQPFRGLDENHEYLNEIIENYSYKRLPKETKQINYICFNKQFCIIHRNYLTKNTKCVSKTIKVRVF